jgi:hypothetical protein
MNENRKCRFLVFFALVILILISVSISGCTKTASPHQTTSPVVQATNPSTIAIPIKTDTSTPSPTVVNKDVEALQKIGSMTEDIGPLVLAVKNDGMNSEWTLLKQDSLQLKGRSFYWKNILLDDNLYYQVSPEMGLILNQLSFALDDYGRGADYYIAGINALNSGDKISAYENIANGVERINQAERQVLLTDARLQKLNL